MMGGYCPSMESNSELYSTCTKYTNSGTPFISIKGNSHQNLKNRCVWYDRATPGKFFGVSLACIRSLVRGSQQTG